MRLFSLKFVLSCRFVLYFFVRMEQLETLRSSLEETRDLGNIQDGLEVSTTTIGLLQAFEDEVASRQQEAKTVGRLLAVVREESEERARGEAGRAHEHALMAACRLWEASAVEGMDQRASRSNSLRLELTRVEEEGKSGPSFAGAEGDSSTGVAPEAGRKAGRNGLSKAAAEERSSERAQTERLRMVQGEAVREAESSNQQASVAPAGEGLGGASIPAVDGGAQVEGSVTDVKATPRTASSDPAPVTVGENMGKSVDEVKRDIGQPSRIDAIDATLVSDATVVRSSAPSLNGYEESRRTASDTSSIEVVVGEPASYVDVDVEVEDDVSDPTRVGLKFLDVSALLIEKILFVGLPTLVSGGSLVWERVDNAINGAKGRKGWKLLNRLKKDSIGLDDT